MVTAAEHRQSQFPVFVRTFSAPVTSFPDAAADEHFCPKFELFSGARETFSNLGPNLRHFCSNKNFGEVFSSEEPDPPKCPRR